MKTFFTCGNIVSGTISPSEYTPSTQNPQMIMLTKELRKKKRGTK